MQNRKTIAAVTLAGVTALFSVSAPAETCNLSATDGACVEAAAAPTAANAAHVGGAGYHPVNLAAKAAGDPLSSFAPAQMAVASGAQSVPRAGGFALAPPFGIQAAPDSPFAWLFALGFLALIVLRRTRPGAFNMTS